MATRKYDQRLRADAAEQTRRRILDAVYQRLCEAPTNRSASSGSPEWRGCRDQRSI